MFYLLAAAVGLFATAAAIVRMPPRPSVLSQKL
jgi:hypothetical protein